MMIKLFAACALLTSIAAAGTLQLREMQATDNPDLHTNGAVAAASPAAMKGTPVMYFGVNACGVRVFWLVFDDGHMARLDQDHHPKDLEGFMKTIQTLPHDLVMIPCPAQL